MLLKTEPSLQPLEIFPFLGDMVDSTRHFHLMNFLFDSFYFLRQDLPVYPKLVSNLKSPCLSLSSAGVMGVHQDHTASVIRLYSCIITPTWGLGFQVSIALMDYIVGIWWVLSECWLGKDFIREDIIGQRTRNRDRNEQVGTQWRCDQTQRPVDAGEALYQISYILSPWS